MSILPNSRVRRSDQALQIFEPADVACHWQNAAGCALKLLGDIVQRLLLAAADDHRRAFFREQFGDGSSDAAARAGDDGDFVDQSRLTA